MGSRSSRETDPTGSPAVSAARKWEAIGPPSVDPELLAAVIELERASRLHEDAMASALLPFVHLGIRNVGDFRLLALLRRSDGEPVKMSDLADDLDISKPAMSKRIERLESAGLVSRTPTTDRRVALVRLPDTSHGVVDEALTAILSSHRALFQRLNTASLVELRSLLEQVRR